MSESDTKLLTFDCYGTLIDWETGVRAYLGRVLEDKGVEAGAGVETEAGAKAGTPANDRPEIETFYGRWYERQLEHIAGPFKPYRKVLRDSLQETLGDFGLPVEKGDGEDFGDDMETWEPFPESAGVLARLREAGYTLTVVSNSQHDIIRHAVEKLGSPFDHVVTAEDVEAYKPDARPFERALELAGVGRDETVHICRSQEVDLPRSVPMGITTVWINRTGERLAEGVPEPDYELADLTGLPDLLGLPDTA